MRSKIKLAALACSYFTDHLMTIYFSDERTINIRSGGDKWARALCGQIGWLSEPLHRADADCSGCTNLKMQSHGKHEQISPHPKHTTKSTGARRPRPPRDGSRRHTSVPWVSPHSPASMDPGFVEIGLLQLSQSAKTTSVTHAHTYTRTDTDEQAD